MQEEHIEAPTTIKEVGIHIGYMRQDIADLTRLVKDMPNGFATKTEMLEHDKRITALEKAKAKNWLFNTASAGVGALLFFLIQYAITHP